jgi:hypothetical protein
MQLGSGSDGILKNKCPMEQERIAKISEYASIFMYDAREIKRERCIKMLSRRPNVRTLTGNCLRFYRRTLDLEFYIL